MKSYMIILAVLMACSGCPEAFDSSEELDQPFESHIHDAQSQPEQEATAKQEQPKNEPCFEEPVKPVQNPSQPDIATPVADVQKHESIPRGHCDDMQNRTHFFADNHEFAENLFQCVDQGWTTADLNMDRIAEKYPQMTRECLTCFEAYTKCTADNCKRHCRPTWTGGPGERSKPCKKCAWKYCGDAMEKCTGLPRASLPDFKR